MRAVDIIAKKRDGLELGPGEIAFVVEGITSGIIPDCQAAAFLMATYLRGLNLEETLELTLRMATSGGPLPQGMPFFLDKHSTGGVGDKATLVVGALVAACGVPVGKMSGRGLGHTGGTIDKLESIPGFRPGMDRQGFLRILDRVGFAILAQSQDMAPADGRMYALRDVTATVDSIPLIVSSVVSKKLATGAAGVVFDIKAGDGAFARDLEGAFSLARTMVEVSTRTGLRSSAVVSGMEQPLGRAVGNALEVKEALECLAGRGPQDLEAVCLDLGVRMLGLAGWEPTKARGSLEDALYNGQGLDRFRQMVHAQGGTLGTGETGSYLPRAGAVVEMKSPVSGFVKSIGARAVGEAAMLLGAGRTQKDQPVDPAVGVVLLRKIGDRVGEGEGLCLVHHRQGHGLAEALARLGDAFAFSEETVDPPPLLLGCVPA
ncbi:MAG: thymidine phosphorylase [Bacillota bacterium]